MLKFYKKIKKEKRRNKLYLVFLKRIDYVWYFSWIGVLIVIISDVLVKGV